MDLNRARAAEEARGLVRWLRPDYQNPAGRAVAVKGEQGALDIGPAESTAKTPWPKAMPDQNIAVLARLRELGEASPTQIARYFSGTRTATIEQHLQILVRYGQAHVLEPGRFAS